LAHNLPMEFQDVVRRRRMVRNFDDRPLDPKVVERLLANAVRAPSAGFTQGTAFLVLEGPEETKRFWDASAGPAPDRARRRWPGVLRAPLVVVCLASERAYRERYAEADKAHARIGEVPWWYVDGAFAALLLLLGAVDAGLGARFFGVADFDGVRAAFGVPADHAPVGAVAIGHPLPDEPSASLARGRRSLDEVVHRGRW
jgi:nitroreductase